jgi:hypothetical protein
MYRPNIASHFGFLSWSATKDRRRAERLSARAAALLIAMLSLALWGFAAAVIIHII